MRLTALIPATPTIGKTTSRAASGCSFRCRVIYHRYALARGRRNVPISCESVASEARGVLAAVATGARALQSGSWPTNALIWIPATRRWGCSMSPDPPDPERTLLSDTGRALLYELSATAWQSSWFCRTRFSGADWRRRQPPRRTRGTHEGTRRAGWIRDPWIVSLCWVTITGRAWFATVLYGRNLMREFEWPASI
jgi:hypothetical protein